MLLTQDLQYLKGVGPRRAELLAAELSVRTVEDLLGVYPYRYIDRSLVCRISQLREGMQYVQIRGKIQYYETEGEGRGRRLKALFSDGAGVMELVWFAGIAYVQKLYRPGTEYTVMGQPHLYGGRWSIAHPELEEPDGQLAPFAPLYRTTERMKRAGLTSKGMEKLIAAALEQTRATIPETLPPYIVQKAGLCTRSQALEAIHAPTSLEALEQARRRLKFEELFYTQLGILDYARQRQERAAGQTFTKIGSAFLTFYKYHLPFELTDAQKRVLREIRADVGSGRQMNRLLQGDVGSGKTIVALMAMLMAVDNGRQAVLMAPTEILAAQHRESIGAMLEGMPVRVDLLTSSVKGRQRRAVLEGTASGETHILIGTHAVIEDSVEFARLGLAVIDEQHRFGVAQRARLWTKSPAPPHILVMTATPIPRTLAMTVYGDLNVSVLDQLPPGRRPVTTVKVEAPQRAALYRFIESQLAAGHQAYCVYPLIKENEKTGLRDLERGYETLCSAFPQHRVEYIHGQMPPGDKAAVMQRFADGNTDILVATTVIEVGVNVPRATVMVIEEAQRFGLAQLHQLRGRVGRSAEQAYCFLVTPEKLTGDTRRRIDIMTATCDGFRIAEEDLKLRGPGDLQGTLQSGLPFNLKIADLALDGRLLEEARRMAHDVIDADPAHNHSHNDLLWQQLRRMRRTAPGWEEIS
jgi:ATP-dependent DNA helicase RecG